MTAVWGATSFKYGRWLSTYQKPFKTDDKDFFFQIDTKLEEETLSSIFKTWVSSESNIDWGIEIKGTVVA